MRAQLAERLGLARDLIQSRGRDGGEFAILGLHEPGNLLQELHQRGRYELAVLGTDRRQTAHRDDRLIERGERGVVAAVGFTPLASARFEIVRCHLAILTS